MKFSLIRIAGLVVAAGSLCIADVVDIQPTDSYSTVLAAGAWQPTQKVYSLANTSFDWIYWQGTGANGQVVCQPSRGWIAPSTAVNVTLCPGPLMAIAPAGTYTDQVSLDFSPRLVGDINGDGVVDIVDVLMFADAMGKAKGDPGYDPACDFNGDNVVDLLDMVKIANSFGQKFGGTAM